MANSYQRILVHCLVNIGDVVLSTGALALLRQSYPDAKITMMARADVAEVLENHPAIDEVLVYDYKRMQRSWGQQLRFLLEIRKRKFDLVISLDRKLRPAVLSWLAGIPVRVVPDKVFDPKPTWITKLYTHVIATPADFRHSHQAEIFQTIIRGFTGTPGYCSPAVGRILAEHHTKADSLIGRLPVKSVRIGLCVKGTYPLKNWPPANFVAVIEALAKKVDAAFYIVGAPGDREYAEEIISATQVVVDNFCGETSLMELAALLTKTQMFITIDTGAMHIGAAVDVPIVGIFRCVSVKRWWPLTSKAKVLANRLAGCPQEGPLEICPHHYCVGEIAVDKVLQAAEELLA
jgi:ADP-heptose:LPS heptosyltransferase